MDFTGGMSTMKSQTVEAQILGFGFIAQRAEDKIHHGLLVFLDQFRKRRAVAALDAQHQRSIGIGS